MVISSEATRILIVDDEMVVLHHLRQLLSRLGYAIAGEAVGGPEAVEEAKRLQPDLVIMDIVMQGSLDGIEACSIIQQECDIPVVLLSGFSNEHYIQRAREASPYAYLLKPFRNDQIKAAVEIALERKVQERTLQHMLGHFQQGTRQSELFFRVLESSPAGTLVAADSGAVLFCNRRFGEVTGYGQHELSRVKDWFDAAFPDPLVRTEIESHWNIAVSDGETSPETTLETSANCRNGEAKDLRLQITPLPGGGRILTITDITARKDAERELQKAHDELADRVEERTRQLRESNDKLRREIAERKEAEAHLRRAHDRLTLHMENSPLGVVEWDERLVIQRWSRGAERIFGWKAEEAVGRAFPELKLVDREDAPKVSAKVRRLQDGRESRNVGRNRNFNKSGGLLHCEWHNSAIPEPDGGITVLSLIQDVTEQRLAEEALRESEERFRVIAEAIQDVFWMSSPGLERMIYVSPAYERIWGCSREELYRRPTAFIDAVHPRDREAVLAEMDDHRRGRWDLEYRIVGSNGEVRWIRDRGFPVFDSEGRLQVMTGIATDITERKQFEEALRESETSLRAVIDATTQVIMLIEADGRVIAINESTAARFGLSQEQLEGTDVFLLFPPDVAAARREKLIEAGRNRSPVRFVDRREGRIYDTNIYPITDDEGEVTRFAVFSQDVTERMAAEEALKKAHENLERRVEERTRELTREIEDRKRAEEALRLSEARLSEAQRMARIGDWDWDARTGEMWWSDEMFRLFGVSERGFVPSLDGYFLFVPLEERDKCRSLIDNALAGLQDFVFEHSIARRDGSRATLWVRGHVKTNTGGKPAGLRGTTQDITDRKAMETALKEHEEQYRILFREMLTGYALHEIVCGEDGLPVDYVFLDVNPAFERLTGLSRETVLNRRALDVLPDTEGYWIEVFGRVALTGSPEHMEEYSVHFDKFFEVSIFSPRQGQFAVTFTDITEKRRAQDRLRESELHYRTLFDSAGEAIILHDLSGDVIDVNSFGCQLFKHPYERMLDMNVQQLLAPERLELYPERVEHLRTVGSIYYESVFVDDKGKQFPAELNAKLIPYKNKETVLAIIRDVSERKNMERQLLQSQKMEAIGTLASGIAHDFNNMLFAAAGYTELLLEDLPEDSEVSGDLSEILKVITRARDLVKQILTFSRGDKSPRAPMEPLPVVKEILRFLRASLPKTVEIHPRLAETSSMIVANPTQLHQILINLVTNAADALPDHTGSIEIAADVTRLQAGRITGRMVDGMPPGEYFRLQVVDNGVGMEESVRERIFDPFFTTKEPGKGTGMGLAVVHGIVKSLGGSISVSSRPGGGTRFVIVLPTFDGKAEEEASSAEPAEVQADGGKERVLVVDDEETLLEMLSRKLKRLGYRVHAYSDPERALRALREDPEGFDLVVTDLSMPRITGIRLSEEIRKFRSDLPIVLCTGYSEKLVKEELARLKISRTVIKPVLLDEFAKTVREVLTG